jgi:hypothetical protein
MIVVDYARHRRLIALRLDYVGRCEFAEYVLFA